MRRAFTLTELLVVMLIISILAGLTVAGISAAVTDAKRSRTRTIIDKVDSLIAEKWEGYRTRSVPIRLPAGVRAAPEPFVDANGNKTYDAGESFTDTNGNGVYDHGAAWIRLLALRELQRIEIPDRISDLCNGPELADLAADADLDAINDSMSVRLASLTTPSSVTKSFKRIAERNIEGTSPKAWSTEFQGSECLYLILAATKDGDKSALDYFQPSEIGDTDGDGMKEVLDGWGRPLEFLRWTPGYIKENLAVTEQSADITKPDPFDPLHTDGQTYAIRPLIYSPGMDGLYHIERGNIVYVQPSYPTGLQPNELPNDPYYNFPSGLQIGTPDPMADGWQDNITNHFRE